MNNDFNKYIVFTGTRVEDAKAIFTTSDLRILAVDNLEEAAKMVTLIHCPLFAPFTISPIQKYIVLGYKIFSISGITNTYNSEFVRWQ